MILPQISLTFHYLRSFPSLPQLLPLELFINSTQDPGRPKSKHNPKFKATQTHFNDNYYYYGHNNSFMLR